MSDRLYTFDEQMIINTLKSELPHICYYCNKKLTEKDIVTVDHKIPFSRGGLTTKENLVIACADCNCEKDNMTEEEYYTYKNEQKQFQDNFEVSKSINALLELQNNIISRIETVKNEYGKLERQIEYLQQEMIFKNFNASEGYLYAKKLKELFSRKHELSLIKEEYKHLSVALGNQSKQISEISNKVKKEVTCTTRNFIKRKIIGESVVSKSNVFEFKNAVNS